MFLKDRFLHDFVTWLYKTDMKFVMLPSRNPGNFCHKTCQLATLSGTTQRKRKLRLWGRGNDMLCIAVEWREEALGGLGGGST